MRREQTQPVREMSAERDDGRRPLGRLRQRERDTTRRMHERLLRALGDRRFKRASD